MRRNLRFAGLSLLILILFSGCRKWINEENRLEGRWRLVAIERINFLSWRSVQNDYREGLFTFFNNGAAVYDDDPVQMNGSWHMRKHRAGYYDNDGEWRTDQRIDFDLELYDFSENRVLKLYFDQLIFRGRDRFLAEYRTPNYRYRYDFRRD